ncbi:MAG: hypothetical protein FJW32_21760 [Acidobacteria bacterium]|nr:hypothetical protein [Acidobacteriota bacterium]
MTLQIDPDVSTGRFSGDSSEFTGPLHTSMNWLRLRLPPGGSEPDFPLLPGFNVESQNWRDLKEAGTLFLPKPDPQVLGVYVREDIDSHPASSALSASATVQLAICFGRPTRAKQSQSSPILESTPTGPIVKSTIILGPATPMLGTPATEGKRWFFPLGKIGTRPDPDSNITHRYEFAIGVILRDGSKTRYYGEDPEMDIGEN